MPNLKKYIALGFTLLFISIICAPTINHSIDNTLVISILFDYGEQDDSDVLILTFEDELIKIDVESTITTGVIQDKYQINFYLKPLISFVFPPPDTIT